IRGWHLRDLESPTRDLGRSRLHLEASLPDVLELVDAHQAAAREEPEGAVDRPRLRELAQVLVPQLGEADVVLRRGAVRVRRLEDLPVHVVEGVLVDLARDRLEEVQLLVADPPAYVPNGLVAALDLVEFRPDRVV